MTQIRYIVAGVDLIDVDETALRFGSLPSENTGRVGYLSIYIYSCLLGMNVQGWKPSLGLFLLDVNQFQNLLIIFTCYMELSCLYLNWSFLLSQ